MDYHENWREEMRSAYLYTVMAKYELNAVNKKLFQDLHEAAQKQAQAWEKKMRQEGATPPSSFVPDLRTRIVANLVRLLGTQNVHFILSAMKIRGMSVFRQGHTETRHTSSSMASNLRAAVFGINDGLISNMSLILGVAGANANEHFIIVAGVAGLLAGACSMGAGEYISVLSQKEVFEYQIALERAELEEYPEEETEELALIYQARGIPKEEAEKLAQLMISNPETGLNTLAREELGLDPESLVSPIGAMLFSFIAFSIGAVLPLLPFMFGHASGNIFISMAITAVTLFSIGAILSLFTDRSPWISGFRMLTVGVIAGAVTFGIGKLFGVATG